MNDPEYLDEVYAGSSKKRDKYRWITRATSKYWELYFLNTNVSNFIWNAETKSVGITIPHELHRMRRAPLNAFFSKASIRRLEPMIRDIVVRLLNRMNLCGKSGEIMSMNLVYKALTADIITRYCFGISTNYMDREDYNRGCFEAIDSVAEYVHWMVHVGWLGWLVESIPLGLLGRWMPAIAYMLKLRLVNSSNQILTIEFD